MIAIKTVLRWISDTVDCFTSDELHIGLLLILTCRVQCNLLHQETDYTSKTLREIPRHT